MRRYQFLLQQSGPISSAEYLLSHTPNHFDEDDSEEPQPLLRSSYKDQSLKPTFHRSNQEAEDLDTQPHLLVEYAEAKDE